MLIDGEWVVAHIKELNTIGTTLNDQFVILQNDIYFDRFGWYFGQDDSVHFILEDYRNFVDVDVNLCQYFIGVLLGQSLFEILVDYTIFGVNIIEKAQKSNNISWFVVNLKGT